MNKKRRVGRIPNNGKKAKVQISLRVDPFLLEEFRKMVKLKNSSIVGEVEKALELYLLSNPK